MAANSSGVSAADSARFRELFEKLDANKDGKIEVNELAQGLQTLRGVGTPASKGHAQVATVDHGLSGPVNTFVMYYLKPNNQPFPRLQYWTSTMI